MWQQQKDYTRAKLNDSYTAKNSMDTMDADVLILGDSRAKSGLIPEELSDDDSLTIYNMAIGGATPIEMYYSLSHYLESHNAPDKILMIYAPYHFIYMDNWGQTMSFNYLSLREFAEVYFNAIRLDELEDLSAGSMLDIIAYKLHLPNKYMASLYEAASGERYKSNVQKYSEICDNLGYTEFGTNDGDDGLNYDTHYDWFDDSKLVDYYYEKILELCSANNIDFIYIQSPINEASSQINRSEYLAGYNKILKNLTTSHGYSYKKEQLPVYDNKYFGDANHLNREGATKFTAEIKERYFD